MAEWADVQPHTQAARQQSFKTGDRRSRPGPLVESLYNLPRPDIQRHLTNVLSLKGLKLPHKRSYLRALELYTRHPFLDFVDALNIAHMERLRIPMILSFDRDFDRVPEVTRREAVVFDRDLRWAGVYDTFDEAQSEAMRENLLHQKPRCSSAAADGNDRRTNT